MTEATAMKFVGFQAPANVVEAFEKLAKANDRSLSAEMRMAMKTHLEVVGKAA